MKRTVTAILRWCVCSVTHWLMWSVVLVIAVLFYAGFIEPAHIVVEEVNVDIRSQAALPAPASYRLVFISDLDMRRPPGWFERRVRRQVNALQPDLIAIGGDLFGGDGNHLDDGLVRAVGEWLDGFVARDGVHVVWGEQELLKLDQVRAVLPPGVTDVHHTSVFHGFGNGRIRVSGPRGIFSEMHVDERGDGWLRAGWGHSLTVARHRGGMAEPWRGSDTTARIHLQEATDSVGLAVLESQTHAGYRFRVVPERREWALVRPLHLDPQGNTRDRAVYVAARGYYQVRIRVEPAVNFNRVRSKIWPADSDEPTDWPIDFQDRRAERPVAGTVALVAGGGWEASSKQGWDWVRVRDLDGGDLLYENFDDAGRFDEMWENPGGRPDRTDVRVIIGHDPRLMLDLPDAWRGSLNLVLAGHTHGGQVRLPFFGPLYMDRGVPRDWSEGMTRLSHGRARLYVSRGLGVSGFPVRFLCPPEITLVHLTLSAADPG